MKVIDEIRQRKGLHASLSNITWLSAGRIVQMGGAVIVGIPVARYLGPGGFGTLNYAIAIYSIFNIVSNLGLDILVVRDVALHPEERDEILGSSFLLKIVASLVTTAAAIGTAYFLSPRDHIVPLLVALLSIAAIGQGLDVIDYFFQAHTLSRYSVIPRTVVFVLASAGRILAVLAHASLLVFGWIAAIEILLADVGLGVSYLYFHRTVHKWRFRSVRALGLLYESWPLLLTGLLALIYMRIDQVLLGAMTSTKVVGVYTVAVRLSEIWYMIPTIICASVMPRLFRDRHARPELFRARLQRLYEAMALLSVGVAIVTQFVGSFAVNLMYGQQYAGAARILSVHIWTSVFVFVGCVGSQQLIAEGLTIFTAQRAALGAVVNVVLNLLWIPRYGAMGSAMATLVAQSIASYFADAINQRTRHIFKMKTMAYLRFWLLPVFIFKRNKV
jgi:PST family polysaccharide transporter